MESFNATGPHIAAILYQKSLENFVAYCAKISYSISVVKISVITNNKNIKYIFATIVPYNV